MKSSNKRNDIIEAFLELVYERDLHVVSMDMVARRAGVGTATIYRYFTSKDNLILDLYNELEERVLTDIRGSYPANSHVKARFSYLGTAIFRYFLNNPLIFRFMEQYHNSPCSVTFRQVRLKHRTGDEDMFTNIIKKGVNSKELKDLPFFVQFALAFGPLYILVRDNLLKLNTLDDNLINRVVEACWNGMKR